MTAAYCHFGRDPYTKDDIKLSCAIGVAKPLSLFVETFGMSKTLTTNDITNAIKIALGYRPCAIAVSLSFRVPKY